MNKLVWLLAALFVSTGTAAIAGEWITDSRTGCRVWNANPQPDQRAKRSGGYVGDVTRGSGVRQWLLRGKNGDRFKGALAIGRRHGKGTMQWADGGRYDGAWRNDMRAGRGVMVWPDGRQ